MTLPSPPSPHFLASSLTPSTLSVGRSSAATSPSDEARLEDASRWRDEAVERAADRADVAEDQREEVEEGTLHEPQPLPLEEAGGAAEEEEEGMLSGSLTAAAAAADGLDSVAAGTGAGASVDAETIGGGAPARAPATPELAAAVEEEAVGPRERGRAEVDFCVRSRDIRSRDMDAKVGGAIGCQPDD